MPRRAVAAEHRFPRDTLRGVFGVTDYYQLLGISRSLNVSLDELQKRYYELSRQLHPDRFMQKPEAEQQRALDMSSALNDAYRTLKDPVKRAQYLLSQEGFDVGEQRSKDVPSELLEEVFELNMALEEMRSGDDSARPQLEAAEKNFTNMLADVDQQLESLFEKYDQFESRAVLTEIRGVLNRRKYILNLVAEVHKTLSPATHAPQPTA
ncbi:MAG TPA: Fe-S protein assembly co-chaperone HscB [Bryobacteraceae bacterium]|nr:Fe-S protein assembly co-chaperone HscB [Bryobacteraceae bacterium]